MLSINREPWPQVTLGRGAVYPVAKLLSHPWAGGSRAGGPAPPNKPWVGPLMSSEESMATPGDGRPWGWAFCSISGFYPGFWPGTHQSAVCMCVCDTARLPRMEARHGDRAQMAGDVLINSMQEVLSPGWAYLRPPGSQPWILDEISSSQGLCVSPRASAIPTQPALSTAASLPGGRKARHTGDRGRGAHRIWEGDVRSRPGHHHLGSIFPGSNECPKNIGFTVPH